MKNRLKYFLIFGISLLLIGSIGMSYAIFTTNTERQGALNIIAANTSCSIESEELDENNQITVGVDEEKKITIKLTNASIFNVKSLITYTGTDIEVTYDSSSEENIAIEELPTNEQREIILYLKNTSQQEQVITIKAKCGLLGKDIILEEGEKSVENVHKKSPATLKVWALDSPEDFHNSEYRTKVTSIEFKTNTSEVPPKPIQIWRVEDTNCEEVTAYLLDDGTTIGNYKVIISTTSPILYANPDSSNIFYGFTSLEKIIGLDLINTSKVTNMSFMFLNCNQLASIGDLSSWDTSSVTDMSNMFYGCNQLSDLSSISNWVTSNVTNMSFMFWSCKELNELKLNGWNTSKVIYMSKTFGYCSTLSNLDLSGWVTSSVTDMSNMFYNCSQLNNVINLSGLDTSKVTDMSNMFFGCKQLTKLDLSQWITSNVINMKRLFYRCESLEELKISSWDTSNVTDMDAMFMSCSQLSTTLTIRGNVSNYDKMLYGAATADNTSITLNYVDDNTSTIVDRMLETPGKSSHVSKGSLVA